MKATPGELERADWTPKDALQFYCDGKHFDVVEDRTRIIDTGAIASNALKHLSIDYLELKGDAAHQEAKDRIATLEAELAESRARVAELERLCQKGVDECTAWENDYQALNDRQENALCNMQREIDAAHAATEQMREDAAKVCDKHSANQLRHGSAELAEQSRQDALFIRALPLPDGAKVLAERDTLIATLRQEAQIHAQEARTANATIAEIYQAVSGATGEPGNWNGAAPVVAALAERDAEIARLTKERAESSGRCWELQSETVALNEQLTTAHAAIEVAKIALQTCHTDETWLNDSMQKCGGTQRHNKTLVQEALAQLNALDGSCVNRVKGEA